MSASIHLAEVGFYVESYSLNRSLIETLVQVIYLAKHPEEIEKLPSIVEGKPRKLKFRTMFEEIAPGYYDTQYSLASEWAHPGWGSNAFKVTRDDAGDGTVDQGVVYKQDRFTHTFNELVMISLGFLRELTTLFPKTDWKDETLQTWQQAVDSMQEIIDMHIALKGGENNWHRLSRPIWNPVS